MSRRGKWCGWVAAGVMAALISYTVALVVFDPRVKLETERERAAMAQAADYLVRHLDSNGRFEYCVRLDQRPVTNDYNVLRHAGTIYGLALYHELTGEPATKDAILRAARYLLARHVRPVPQQPGMLAVFSLPGEEVNAPNPEIKLGGCALGLIALIKARELDVGVVRLRTLQELGNFIVFAQEPNGRFRVQFDSNGQNVEGFESLYYPGEAILALTLLHRLDPQPRWLDTALKGMLYLEQSRQNTPIFALPNDHWLMIATAAVLPRYEFATAPPISRERLVAQALAIGKMMMGEQRRISWVPGMNGSFAIDSRITPSSTRLEGLAALYPILPPNHPDKDRIRQSIVDGLSFILSAQVKDGQARGGFRGALHQLPFVPDRPHTKIQIDYVQHALSALIAHAQMPP